MDEEQGFPDDVEAEVGWKFTMLCPHAIETEVPAVVVRDGRAGRPLTRIIYQVPECDHTDVVGEEGVIHTAEELSPE